MLILTMESFTTHSGLGLFLLIVGALFTAAVVVSITSFYLDDYWEDEDYRNQLRFGESKKRTKSQ